jgi:hypothetical protein
VPTHPVHCSERREFEDKRAVAEAARAEAAAARAEREARLRASIQVLSNALLARKTGLTVIATNLWAMIATSHS